MILSNTPADANPKADLAASDPGESPCGDRHEKERQDFILVATPAYRLAAGVPREALLYFNFEDERLSENGG